MAQLTVTFWGVRGSIPAPGPLTVRTGGNTSCVSLDAGGERIILDMGSGLRALGEAMGAGPHRATVFLSHYHWDHIQGLPFFRAAYDPTAVLDIHGPVREGKGARALLAAQMSPPFFPVPLDALQASLRFHDVAAGARFEVCGCTVTTCELNHPNGALAYRFDRGGKALVYATDTEHGTAADDALVELARDADLLIYDAMYSEDEYRDGKIGWGHSTWSAGLRIVERARARRLALYHHEPSRTDEELEAMLAEVRREHPEALLAREGESIVL